MDISAAVSGRVPDAGLHPEENRRGEVVFDVQGASPALVSSGVFAPLLGLLIGADVGEQIPVILGLPPDTSEDSLKAIGAAAASSGAVALFHAVGVTPEAPTLETALHGERPVRTVCIDGATLLEMRDRLGAGVPGATLDAVCVGTPHASLAEFDRILAALDGEQIRVPLYVNTGRGVFSVLERRGDAERLRDASVRLVTDTCTYVTPMFSDIVGRVMTSSAKWAYYAPGNIGVEVAFGGLEECVRSAVTGKVQRDDSIWM